jgi:hypothetical protein
MRLMRRVNETSGDRPRNAVALSSPGRRSRFRAAGRAVEPAPGSTGANPATGEICLRAEPSESD